MCALWVHESGENWLKSTFVLLLGVFFHMKNLNCSRRWRVTSWEYVKLKLHTSKYFMIILLSKEWNLILMNSYSGWNHLLPSTKISQKKASERGWRKCFPNDFNLLLSPTNESWNVSVLRFCLQVLTCWRNDLNNGEVDLTIFRQPPKKGAKKGEGRKFFLRDNLCHVFLRILLCSSRLLSSENQGK